MYPLSKICKIARQLSGSLDATALPDDNLVDLVNEYYQIDMPLELRLPQLKLPYQFATTAGFASYSIPGNIIGLSSPSCINSSGQLKFFPPGFARPEFISSEITGMPSFAFIESNKIQLRPIPDGVYQIELQSYVRPPPLINVTDEPVAPELGELIAVGTARKILANIGDVNGMANLQPLYDKRCALALAQPFQDAMLIPGQRSF